MLVHVPQIVKTKQKCKTPDVMDLQVDFFLC